MVVVFPLLLTFLLAASAAAQQPKAARVEDRPRFATTVSVVTAPVTVTGPDDRYVAGLAKEHFRIFDNDTSQEITGFDVSFLPISLVLCVQSSERVESWLPQIRKTGILYSDLVIGESGEAALISFDGRVEVRQEFTRDSTKFIDAVKKIKIGSDATHMADAVWQAIRMLRARPDNHRKVIVIVAESREDGSETSLGEALRDAQVHNIIIYSVKLSAAKGRLMRKPEPRRDPVPPGVAGRPLPPGVVGTPTAVAQSRYEVVDALPVIIEMVRGVKNLIFNDPLQLLTQGTGGKELSPLTQKGMEVSVTRIGEELRSQYLLTYRPNNLETGGFHRIRVELAVNGLKSRTRPGYWLGPIPNE